MLEAVTVCIFLVGLLFNSKKTTKIGKQYDELNLTASNFTAYVNISAAHRFEFDQTYGQKMQKSSSQSRGIFYQNYIKQKVNLPNANIVRIDLVFDNTKM